ncbi:U3 snoRNP-associated protein-like EMB2271 [Tasmannia lanceolata]|uniref:U3 snoRNP-associated protein-like EMB2271 n=1 Tax=Tasmannia lanceolata TaxID=3420 RepID=UPI0040647E14
MKKSRDRKKPSISNASGRKKARFSINEDPFFSPDPKQRRQKPIDDDVIESSDSGDDSGAGAGGEGDESEQFTETAAEKKLRVANEYLEKIRAITKLQEEEEDEDEEGTGTDEEKGEREGNRDSLVAEFLQKEQLEESGRVRRSIASRVQKPHDGDVFRVIERHKQSVTAVALAEDDSKGFSASKDGTILHWDVNSGKSEKYVWPSKEILSSHGAKNPQNPSTKWSRHVLALSVSSDGRYLSTGGLDRHVHLWDTRTREHIQAFPGHRGPVSCLTFRQGTTQLFSGSFDRSIKVWNAEDRTYLDTLFGHKSEVLMIDCLRKELVLSVARDRTMRLFKVEDASQKVFLAPPSSLECCCFVNNEEFLSGSDDGSIELWASQRKKPAYIVNNAHVASIFHNHSDTKENGRVSDCDTTENGNLAPERCSSAQSWVSAVTVCRGSDLAASGAGNGMVRLWEVESDSQSIRPLYDLPLVGFVNSLAFAKSGRFLIAGVGQEPRLGRWGRVSAARNGVALQSLKLSEDT